MKNNIFNRKISNISDEKRLDRDLFDTIFRPLNFELTNVQRKLKAISDYDQSLKPMFFDVFLRGLFYHNFASLDEMKNYLEGIMKEIEEVERNGRQNRAYSGDR